MNEVQNTTVIWSCFCWEPVSRLSSRLSPRTANMKQIFHIRYKWDLKWLSDVLHSRLLSVTCSMRILEINTLTFRNQKLSTCMNNRTTVITYNVYVLLFRLYCVCKSKGRNVTLLWLIKIKTIYNGWTK